MKLKSRQRRSSGRRQPHPQGSTLLIVMVLMGMLSLLGVIFYVFAAQERSNSEYYSEASKETGDPGLDADVLFDWALEQIIVGTDPRLKNSVLWGSRHSLLSNALGYSTHRPDPNVQPFNGEGINVVYDTNTGGALGVDQNRNGLIDDPTVNGGENDNRYLLNYVDSPATRSNLYEPNLAALGYPQSDVGYTYPDINNVFLCYVGKVRDNNGVVHQVVKPSYLVPGLFRSSATAAPNAGWYNDSNTASRVMRGHPNHYYVPPNATPAAPAPRYLTNAEATTVIGPGATGFPVIPMNGAFPVAATSQGRIGAYSVVDTTGTFPPNEPVEMDYDNDGDGICESILMDLDFPPQQDSTGKIFVPLFLITIHDLDSLLNLNVHGNLAKVQMGPTDVANGVATTSVSSGGSGNWFGMDSGDGNFYSISQSNLGLGPAEINPIWALNRRIGVDDTFTFTEHQKFFGSAPTAVTIGTVPAWGESANMEFLWSKIGRFQSSPFDLYVGVYGEPAILYAATNNGVGPVFSTPGGNKLPRPGLSLADDQGDIAEGQGTAPFFQHPLDYTGQGSFLTGLKTINWATPGGGADAANRWIKYTKYADSSPSNVRWGQAGLITKTLSQGLGDDPYEVVTYPTDSRDFDSLFTAEEMLYLMLNNSEIDRLNVNSRLANLLPFNFDKKKGTNSRAEYIRRKFTVSSNDRKSFGLPVSARSSFEYNLDSNSQTLKFPPQFGAVTRYSTAALAEDPFRPAVRYLLEIELNGQQGVNRPQRKLSLNGLLTGSATTPLAFRPLTTHPDDPGTTPITTLHSVSSMPAYPPTDAASQEFWARRDRQQLARDIYVLLYLLGHGVDATNTTTSGAYTTAQCTEMAQFAVNLVDAMDRDSVITRFEYDTDLSNGWSLDDDPYTSPSTTPPTTESDWAEVYGVERLDLSISEVMAVRTEVATPAATDHASTSYDDSKEHHFAYVELYNQSPFDVNFSDNEVWQVVMKQAGKFERRVSFKSGATKISSGQRFTFGSADGDVGGGGSGKSLIEVDPMGASAFVQVAPYDAAMPATVKLNVDMVNATTPTSVFRVEDGTANPPTDQTGTIGSWAAGLTSGDATIPVNFALRRRVHPTRSYMGSANDNDNPWVTVDEMNLPKFSKFALKNTDGATEIQTALQNLDGGYERAEPFGGTSDENKHGKNPFGFNNSLTKANSNAANPFAIWQPHFDRDYASIIDLFTIPVFAPSKLTANLRTAMKTALEDQTTPMMASDYFLNPNTAVQNRWHRLLEFVEVPTRTNKNLGVGTEFSIPRVPGRMNLNTLRYPDNYAGLMDDNRYYSLDLSAVTAGKDQPATMPDMNGETRDWWTQFISSRDATDYYTSNGTGGATILHLPGLPGSKPFRSLADVSYTVSGGTKTPSVEDTILRSLPMDSKRRLLEVGNAGEHASASIDPTIRHRLLSKIAGNTTPRSNSFAIFISVKYFSAGADPAYNGAIRIGGPYNGTAEPEHRGFFVVDRSKLEQGKYTGAQNYDFRAFIDYRKTLQTQ